MTLNNYVDRGVKAVTLDDAFLCVTFEDDQTLRWAVTDGYVWIGGMQPYDTILAEDIAQAFRDKMKETERHS